MNSSTSLQAWQRWVKRFVLTILTVLLTWLLVQIVWLIVAPQPLYLPAPSVGNVGSSTASQASSAQYHVFGEMGKEPIIAQKTVDAPDTRLRLELEGVMQASVPELSSAIIAKAGSGGEFYRIDEVVQGRTKLYEVYSDRVILDTVGKLETLKFTEFSARGVGVSAAEQAPRQTSENQAADLRGQFSRIRQPSDFLAIASEASQQDPNAIIQGLGLQTSGSGSGYAVTSGSVLVNAGMQVGDQILSVNGQGLGDPANDQMLLEQVMSEGRAQI
ncbi:MAG: type II secretion system protein N, partial [Oleibacter sp.]|nr:type II secretion system protein N [Thalassolituus sp.]